MSWLKAKDWAFGVEYSSLFHSGLRSISLRSHPRRPRTNPSSSSMQVKGSSGSTSMASFPTLVLGRGTSNKNRTSPAPSTSSDSSPPRVHKANRPRPASMFVRPTKQMEDSWSSGESFFEIDGYQWHKIPDYERRRSYLVPSSVEIDPVHSHSGSKSFFVSSGEVNAAGLAPPPKGDSFLSLSGSPDGSLHHPNPRHERPVSMQAMPPPSRRSSVHHRARELPVREPNQAWMLEESSPELKAYGFGDDEDVLDLALGRDDWRQFHVDWLLNEPTIQLPD